MTNFSLPDTGIDPNYSGDDIPATNASIPIGVREFLAEWASYVTLSAGLSIFRRPDAISLNYQICYTPGPVNLGDVTAGALNRIWRCYTEPGRVLIQRANDYNDGWEAASQIFAFTEPELTEIDAAFNQSAQVFVCAERPTGADGAAEVWIYWFDPTIPDYVFQNIGDGRSPRVALDDFQNVSNSDLILFYFKSSGELVYRIQRERYQFEHATPVIELGGYVEDVYQSSGFRLTVLYSIRNSVTGSYQLRKLVTTLYDFTVASEAATLFTSVVAITNVTEIITYGEIPPEDGFVTEELAPTVDIPVILLFDPVISVSPEGVAYKDEIEEVAPTVTLPTILLTTGGASIILYTAYDVDAASITVTVLTITNVTIVLTYNAYDVDEAQITVAIPTITLV